MHGDSIKMRLPAITDIMSDKIYYVNYHYSRFFFSYIYTTRFKMRSWMYILFFMVLPDVCRFTFNDSKAFSDT